MTDFILRGGEVIDGSGKPAFRADVRIAGERIAAVGKVERRRGAREIDCSGLVVAPGFIDAHTHDDRALLVNPEMAMKASQGVTTVVTGNCGISLAPLVPRSAPPPPFDLLGEAGDFRYPRFADYLEALESSPAALNAAPLVGHSTLRVGAMKELDRPASGEERRAMAEGLEEALAAGAIGMSSGLAYPPAFHAPPAEIEALARVLKKAGGIYATHMRDEGARLRESLEESFAVGRAGGIPVVISHLKAAGRENFGRTKEALALFERAMARQEVGADAYPYTASSTVLHSGRLGSSERVLVTWSKSVPEAAGRELSAIAKEWGVSEEEAAERLKPAGAIYFMMDEADVRRVLGFAHTMIGSDGLPHDRHPHPRLWGTFPRVLGHYSREVGLFPLAEAVRRMTSLPALRFGLEGRGRIALGNWADITVFDPSSVGDRASFEEPTLASTGIEHVFVGGRPVWSEGKTTGERPGRVLRRPRLSPGLPRT